MRTNNDIYNKMLNCYTIAKAITFLIQIYDI